MIKRLLKSVGEYKLPTMLTPVFIIGEAVIEALMPFIIANIINDIKAGCNMSDIAKNGGILFIMACISLDLPHQKPRQDLRKTSERTYSTRFRIFRLRTSTSFPRLPLLQE